MKKVKDLKRWVDGYNEVKKATEELQLAFDFYKESIVSEEEVDSAYTHVFTLLESMEMKNMLSSEEDHLGAVLKIVSVPVEQKVKIGHRCCLECIRDILREMALNG